VIASRRHQIKQQCCLSACWKLATTVRRELSSTSSGGREQHRGSLSEMNLAIALLCWVGIAFFTAWLADFKGRRFWIFFAGGLLVGPVAFFIALVIPRPAAVRDAEVVETPAGKLSPRMRRFTSIDDED
jgi:hypothetical protein